MDIKTPIVVAARIFPGIPNSQQHSVLFKDWGLKRKWCEQQGWKLCEDYWAPGSFDGAWHFKEKQQGMLFALRWA